MGGYIVFYLDIMEHGGITLEKYMEKASLDDKITAAHNIARTIAELHSTIAEEHERDALDQFGYMADKENTLNLDHLIGYTKYSGAMRINCIIAENITTISPSDLVINHGDLHMGNVLIDEDKNVKLIDFDNMMLAPREFDMMFIDDIVKKISNAETEGTFDRESLLKDLVTTYQEKIAEIKSTQEGA